MVLFIFWIMLCVIERFNFVFDLLFVGCVFKCWYGLNRFLVFLIVSFGFLLCIVMWRCLVVVGLILVLMVMVILGGENFIVLEMRLFNIWLSVWKFVCIFGKVLSLLV